MRRSGVLTFATSYISGPWALYLTYSIVNLMSAIERLAIPPQDAVIQMPDHSAALALRRLPRADFPLAGHPGYVLESDRRPLLAVSYLADNLRFIGE